MVVPPPDEVTELLRTAGVVDRIKVIGSEAGGLTIGLKRLFHSRLLLQDCPSIEKSFGVVGLELDGPGKGRQRLIGKAPVLQDGSQIIVDGRHPRIERNDPPICRLGGVQLVLLVQDNSEVELRLRKGRL